MSNRHIAPLVASAVAALGLSAGCAHAPGRDVAAPSAALRCEEAAAVLAQRSRTEPLDELRLVLTAPLAYAAAGAGFVADGALVATFAGGGGVLVCLPVVMLEAGLHGDGELSSDCISAVAGDVFKVVRPRAGRGLYRLTRSWRCHDHVRLAREVRSVASCYATRGAPGDAELAQLHLQQLRWEQGIWECLPKEEQRELEGALDALGDPR